MEISTRGTTMYAAIHPRATTLPVSHAGAQSPIHTAILVMAAVIVGSFLIGVMLAASVLLVGPLPVNDGAAPMPQMLPQPSAVSGLDR
jgi:hypothetical protein